MKKKVQLLFSIALLNAMLLLTCAAIAQDRSVLMNETFDYSVGTLPPGWSVIGLGASAWGVYYASSAGGAAPEMRMTYDNFNGDSRLMTQVMNSGDATSLKLSLNIFFYYYSLSPIIKIGYSTDNGATWNDFWQQTCTGNYGPKLDEHTFNIPANTNFRLGFCFSGDGYNIWDFNFDNVKVESVAPTVPLTGTYYIPAGSPGYPTISAAIADMNQQGVGDGGVTFLVASGFTESVTAPILLTATGTAGNTIVFQKNGPGSNPMITRTDAGTIATTAVDAQGDGIIIIQGSDFVTFNGIDVTSQNEGIEYGYYLRKTSTTDACKNVTIKNSVVTMTKGTSPYVCGIYSSNNDAATLPSNFNGITVTSTGGRTENLLIIGNTVQNTHCGIRLRGFNHTVAPYEFLDQNNIVGQSGAGNIIQNFGGGSSAQHTSGIYVIYQTNAKMNFNTVDNAAGGGIPSISNLHGIYLNGTVGGGDVQINNNSVKLAQESTSWVYSIINNAVTCSSIEIKNNLFSFGQYKSTAPSYLIYNSSATNNVTVTGNSNLPFTKSSSGNLIGYYCVPAMTHPTGGKADISNNTFSDITMNGGTFTGISHSTNNQVITIANNSISNLVNSGNIVGILQGRGNAGSTVSNNIIENWTGGGNFTGISAGNPASLGVSVFNNTVRDITTTNTGASLYVYGILTTFGNPCSIYKNNVYNLEANNSNATVYGIFVGSSYGTSVHNIYNNFVSDLRTPITNAAINLAGISVLYGTTSNVFNNTVYLNATSTGALFGSAALYAAGGAVNPVLDMRNNVLVNLSTPNGTGVTAAYRRSTTTLTTYSINSNANCFYAGTPGPNNLIFFDGTTPYQTLSNYQTLVAPRDAASFTENPPFINVATPPYDLHMMTSVPTLCDGGALPITSPIVITDDFDGDLRSATTPDVGADEFDIVPVVHNISLPAGWSGVSSYISPVNPDMGTILSPIMNNLILISNFSGMYYPAGGIFTLNTWDDHSGYVINMSNTATLPIGITEVTNKTVNLSEGWNLIPVLSSSPCNTVDLFDGVGGLDIVKDVAGNGVYWPAYGINSIAYLQPGKAYYVRMNTGGNINFASSDNTNFKPTLPEFSQTPWNKVVNTPASHLVAFMAGLSPVKPGDIIGGFTPEGICAGATEISNPDEAFALTLNADDADSPEKEGFISGNPINYKLYRPATGEIFELAVIYDQNMNTGLFEFNGISRITDVRMLVTGISDAESGNLKIYPNPSTGHFTIEGMNKNVNVRVFNAFGEEVYHGGVRLPAQIKISDQPKGVYYVRMETAGSIKTEKMVIQ